MCNELLEWCLEFGTPAIKTRPRTTSVKQRQRNKEIQLWIMLLIAEFPHYSSFKAGLQIQSNLFQISFRDNTFRFDQKWSRSLSGAAMCSIKVQISYGSCDKSGRFLRAYNYTHRWCLISIQGGEWLNILRLKNVTHAAHQITEGSERILHFYLICWRQEAQWLQTIYDCDTELNMKWFHCTLPGIKDMSRSRV